MSSVGIVSESLDENMLRAIMIRWKLAQTCLNSGPEAAERGRMAIETLMSRDVPILLRQVARHHAGAV